MVGEMVDEVKVGRPSKMTPETVKKLEEAFLLGCSDIEACLYADISKQTLYNYQEAHPEFIDRKEQLKENPVFKARRSVVNGLESNPELALKFLERRKKDEFSPRSEHDHTTNGKDLPAIITLDIGDKEVK